MLEIMHAEGPPHCRDMVQWGWLVGYPDKTNSAIFTRNRKLLVSLNLFSLELLCTVLCQSSILGWFWILSWVGESMWISRWRWLKINCGPIGGLLVQCGAQRLKVVYWLYGSIIRPPSPLHL